MIEDDAIEKGHNGVSEPGVQYGTVSGHHEGLLGEQRGSVPPPRVITDEEMAKCYTLEESRRSMDDMIESTLNHTTGCVEVTPIVPRKCSINDVMQRSMTIEQFSTKLHATVDKFYSSKV